MAIRATINRAPPIQKTSQLPNTRPIAPTAGPTDLNDDPNRVWKDLDAGLDPTGDPDVPDPDVHDGAERVTMDRIHDPRQE